MREDPAFTTRASRQSRSQVDQICDRFEHAWRNGRQPKIEAHLARIAAQQRAELLLELFKLDISYRIARGEKPSPQPYFDRFPADRHLVDQAFREVAEHSAGSGTWPEPPAESAPTREPRSLSRAFPEITERYDDIVEIGEGAMGVVYRAHDKLLDILVAIKLLQPGHSTSRFLREAQILAKITSDYVVRIFDVRLLTGDYPILIMQWVDGIDLHKKIKSQGDPLSEEQVVLWMRQTCEGMSVAADQRIVHRDLKPSNILIDSSDRARVADFGLARDPFATGDLSGSTQIMGTPLYMAPEQAEDSKAVDERSDIYSFGATFYHALTGQPPFTGPTVFSVLNKHRTEPLASPFVRNPQLSQRTSAVLERCLAKSPAERFQSFGQVLSELQRSDVSSPWDTSEDPKLAPYLIVYRKWRDAYLNARDPYRRMDEYDFPDDRHLYILDGDISNQQVDAIVNSTDQAISALTGVSKAIRAAAGADVFHEARRFVPVRPGRVVVSSAGNMNARFIFHAITTGYMQDETVPPSRDIISEILASCFYHAESFNVQSIAFPLLGTGAMGFPRDVCLDTMFRFLARTLLQGVTPVQDVRIVLFPESR